MGTGELLGERGWREEENWLCSELMLGKILNKVTFVFDVSPWPFLPNIFFTRDD
jgi:hypothetical protein